MRACTEYIAAVALARIAIHTVHASSGRAGCNPPRPNPGNSRSSRPPNDCVTRLVQRALVTSAYHVGAIADARLRDHDARRGGIAFDFTTEVRDVNTQVLLGAAELPAPYGVEDLLMGER